MKRVFLALLSASGFLFAGAQNSSNSSTPAGPAPAVTSSASVSVTLHNAIEIQPPMQWTYTTTFQTAADYNGLTSAGDMGEQTWFIKSTKPGTISLSITNLYSPPPAASVIPVNKMSYSLNSGGSWTPASNSIPSVSGFWAGDQTQFKLKMKLTPGWNYQGGIYAGFLTVTATQL